MPRLPLIVLLLTLAAVLVLAACGDDDDDEADAGDGGDRLKVVATVAPITSIAENIGGTKIELTGFVPEGTNSHTYEPPPSDVGLLEDADLIILNGLQLEEPTLELAEPTGNEILLLGDSTIDESEYKYDFSFPEADGKPNPHLWPNPMLTKEYATLIHDKLVRTRPRKCRILPNKLRRTLRPPGRAPHGDG